MKRHKLFKMLYNIFLAIATFSIIASILFYKDGKTPLFIGFLAVAIISVAVAVFFFIKAGRYDKEWISQKGRYNFGAVKESSYREMLTAVREAYNADTDPKKNRIAKPDGFGAKPYLNYNVLNNGKIVYACLAMANTELYKESKHIHKSYPAVLIYSTDECFVDDPTPLISITKALYDDKDNNFLQNETSFYSHYELPKSITDGKNVYATCVLLYRYHLPLGFIKDNMTLMPLIVNPNSCPSSFVVDAKYWPLELVYKYFNLENKSKEEIEEELIEEKSDYIFNETEEETKTRKLSITRKWSFIGCALKTYIFIECPSALADFKGDDDKYYKNAGRIKSGKTINLEITDSETKILVASCAIETAYKIPVGTDNVNLMTQTTRDSERGFYFKIKPM